MSAQDEQSVKGAFISAASIPREMLDWGELGWVSRPASTGTESICMIEVTLRPGAGHDFHHHPRQEEVIRVQEGEIEQWLGRQKRTLKAGDAVFIGAGVVHASFNTGATPARLLVVLSPCVGDGGYELVDVAAQSPWNRLRG